MFLGLLLLAYASDDVPDFGSDSLGAIMDAGAARVAVADPVTEEEIAGRWAVQQALFRVHEKLGPEVRDYSAIIGGGGLGFGKGGAYTAGLFQLPGTYALAGRHLHIVNPQKKEEDYDIAVSGDVMEWYQANPAQNGDFAVDAYLVLRRERPPGDCAEIGDLPRPALPVLDGLNTIALPTGAALRAWDTPRPAMLGTQLIVEAGGTRLEVAVSEMHARYALEGEPRIRSYLAQRLPGGSEGTSTAGGVRSWSRVAPPASEPGPTPTVLAVLAHPSGFLQQVAIRVQSPSPGAGCRALAESVFQSLQTGSRPAAVGPTTFGVRYSTVALDVPPGWLAWSDRTEDAGFLWLAEALPVGVSTSTAGLSLRLPGTDWRATSGETRPLLGEAARWEVTTRDGETWLRACTDQACVEAHASDLARLEPALQALGSATSR